MLGQAYSLLATFTAPQRINTDPKSLLWVLPLAAAVALVYKAIKLDKITARSYIRETVLLFASIVVVIVVAGLILCALAWLVTE